VKFLLNMNVPRELGPMLASAGHEWQHVGDIGLAHATDATNCRRSQTARRMCGYPRSRLRTAARILGGFSAIGPDFPPTSRGREVNARPNGRCLERDLTRGSERRGRRNRRSGGTDTPIADQKGRVIKISPPVEHQEQPGRMATFRVVLLHGGSLLNSSTRF
jgi:hypothetical protein